MILIDVVLNGESGFIIAVQSAGSEPVPHSFDIAGTATVVGQARVTGDGAKAWLWPHPTAYPGTGRSVHAVTAETASDLAAKLRKRHDEKGAWWQ